jgi:hypothetical protein
MQTVSRLSGFFSHDKGAFVLLWLAGLYPRLTVMAAPPLTPTIGEAMDLGQAAMGPLTTLFGATSLMALRLRVERAEIQ